MGDAQSEPIPDAHTSAALVCEALRTRGAKVSAQPITDAGAAGYASAYRVEVRPLGAIVILQVSHESPIGTRRDSRSLQLRGIEEVTVAAPRLAEALLRGTPIGQTAQVGNLVGQETRGYRKEYGEMLAGIGLLGFAYPDDTWSGYGVYGRLHYEARRYAIGADLRLGGSDNSAGDAALGGISLGARYFFSEEDITPFVTGGAGIMWMSVERDYDSGMYPDPVKLSGSGLAGFGEVGVEFMRLHESRFDVLARLDVPFFDLEGAGHRRYRLPFSVMASFSF